MSVYDQILYMNLFQAAVASGERENRMDLLAIALPRSFSNPAPAPVAIYPFTYISWSFSVYLYLGQHLEHAYSTILKVMNSSSNKSQVTFGKFDLLKRVMKVEVQKGWKHGFGNWWSGSQKLEDVQSIRKPTGEFEYWTSYFKKSM